MPKAWERMILEMPSSLKSAFDLTKRMHKWGLFRPFPKVFFASNTFGMFIWFRRMNIETLQDPNAYELLEATLNIAMQIRNEAADNAENLQTLDEGVMNQYQKLRDYIDNLRDKSSKREELITRCLNIGEELGKEIREFVNDLHR